MIDPAECAASSRQSLCLCRPGKRFVVGMGGRGGSVQVVFSGKYSNTTCSASSRPCCSSMKLNQGVR
jgi:hypothetical protein